MIAAALIVLPVFGLVALGFVLAATGLVSARAGDLLGKVIFVVALPIFMFTSVTGATFPPSIPWGYWISYLGAGAIAWATVTVLATRVLRAKASDAVMAGMATAQANTVMVGIPIVLAAYGPDAGLPIVLLLAINLPVTSTVAALLLESLASGGGDRRGALMRLARNLGTNPILLALMAGFVWRLFGLPLPAEVRMVASPIAAAAPWLALVALGTSMARLFSGPGGPGLALRSFGPLAGVVTAVKLVVHPALALLLGTLFALPPAFLGTAVLFAAAPAGVQAYVFAVRYRAGVEVTGAAVLISTVLSVVTTGVWVKVLGIS